jgi:hypothetical protein
MTSIELCKLFRSVWFQDYTLARRIAVSLSSSPNGKSFMTWKLDAKRHEILMLVPTRLCTSVRRRGGGKEEEEK